jgi:hypothetical protein
VCSLERHSPCSASGVGLASRGAVCPAEPPSGERRRDDACVEEHVATVAFTGESGSVSKMAIVRTVHRRFDMGLAMTPADTPDSGITARRDALVPPPLDSVTNEHTTLRGPAGSLPTLEIEVAAALAAAPVPGACDAGAGTAASMQRAMPTPLVMVAPLMMVAMVAPADAGSDAPESGVTRIEPVEQRPRFLRTPIPMPFTIPPATPRAHGARSALQLATLIVAPPLIVMLGIMGMRTAADARREPRAAAPAAPPERAPPAAATPLIVVTPPVAASPAVAPGPPAPVAASVTAHPRPPSRPGHRSPRPARSAIPVPVNR